MQNVSRFMVACLLLTVFCVPGFAQSAPHLRPLDDQSGQVMVLGAMDAESPITIQTTFRIPTKEALSALKGLWIAGLSEAPNSPPTALSLTWSEDSSGWFPVWGLQVAGNGQLFPTNLGPKRGAGFLSGSSYVSTHVATPQVDHVYRADFSYDPRTGQVAVGMTDLTTGARLFSKSLVLQPGSGALYPSVGFAGTGTPVEIVTFTAVPYAVPLATSWDLMVNETGRYTRLAVFRLTPSYGLALRLGADPQGFPGKLVLTMDDGNQVVPLLEQDATARGQDVVLPIAGGTLPLGDVKLGLQYVDTSGQAWELGSRSFLMVAANIELKFGPLALGFDGALHGTVVIQSQDEIVQGLPYRLTARVGGADQKDGTLRLETEGYIDSLTKAPTTVAFSIPVHDDDRLFSVTVDFDFDVPVGKVIQGNQYHVLISR